MPFAKVIKSTPYFKRFQTKFRRRRDGKTDYFQRKNMIRQDVNQYNTPKYRLVARITNSKVICQVIYATIKGDKVLSQAESNELRRHGLTAGLTNYSACYITGLLLARRLLKKIGLADTYKGAKAVDGNDYDVGVDAEALKHSRRAFKAVLDVGLKRTTTGARVFAVLKGACDGGLHIPHSVKRFPGYVKEGKKTTYNANAHKDRIFGVHVDTYMALLKKEDPERFKKQFSAWEKTLKDSGCKTVKDLVTKVIEKVKANPDRESKDKKKEKNPVKYADKAKTVIETTKGKYLRSRKITLQQRKKNVETKLKIAKAKAAKKK